MLGLPVFCGARPLWLRGAAAFFLVAGTAFVSGCATPIPSNDLVDNGAFPEAQEIGEYILQSGDEVQVLFTYWPDYDAAQTIRPDGKITLRGVGDVSAAGKSSQALSGELVGLYESRLRDPEIAVVVAGSGNRRVYVAGEVMQPGLVPLTGRLSLIEAVMQAGGPNKRSAKLGKVVVIRQHEGMQYGKIFDLREVFKDGQTASVELQPFDVVYVPQNGIDRVDQFVDQYINQIVPRNFYGTYTWNDQIDQQSAQSSNVSFNLPSLF